VTLLEAGDRRPMREALAAAVASVPIAADAHQHLDPLGDEHHADPLRRERRVAHQVLRVEADRVALAVVAGAGKSEAAVWIGGVGLIEANFLPLAGPERAGGRAEPPGGDVELVLDDAEQGIGVVDDVRLVGQRVLVSDPEVGRFPLALADIGQAAAAAKGHVPSPERAQNITPKESADPTPKAAMDSNLTGDLPADGQVSRRFPRSGGHLRWRDDGPLGRMSYAWSLAFVFPGVQGRSSPRSPAMSPARGMSAATEY
jgi:hypothetical protein